MPRCLAALPSAPPAPRSCSTTAPRAAPVVEEEVYVRPAPRYVPTCRMERRRVWIDSESYTYRRVEVCE
ncbi:hypothetical protein [Rhabdaerophilum calidifontis]|uniref:hypothetical protein n=1 Tax=Rhabdaerophilum calidifontis TaxID=2604328 RepID=UPI001FEBE544|nr:hypothetical protein [Rhabdaerophilum calidifontis]